MAQLISPIMWEGNGLMAPLGNEEPECLEEVE